MMKRNYRCLLRNHKMNLALTNGLPRMLMAFALARQLDIRLDCIFNYSQQDHLPECSVIKQFGNALDTEVLPIAKPLADFPVKHQPHIIKAIGNIDNLLAIYRPLGSCGAVDRQTLRILKAKKTYGMLEGLTINIFQKTNDAFPQDLYPMGVYTDSNIFEFIRQNHLEVSNIINHKIYRKHFREVEDALSKTDWYRKRTMLVNNFLDFPYSLLLCPVVDQRALVMRQAEHVIILARAAKAILRSEDRLYIKLHPFDSWETSLLLKELLAEYKNRVYISDFRYDAQLPAELLCAQKLPVNVYGVSSTALLHFHLKNIPVFLIDSGTGHFKHIALSKCCKCMDMPAISVNCNDLCISPEHETAFSKIRTVSRRKKNCRKILFGLGRKGKELLEAIDSYYGDDPDLHIDFVVDDSDTYQGFRCWKVHQPTQVLWSPDDIVFLATDTYQSQFRHRLNELNCPAESVEIF